MGRPRPPKQSAQSKALQKIQIASMREKLKLDKAKARQAEADAPSEAVLGPNGRPRVRYKDMPELDPSDEVYLEAQFNRLACPHAAVLEYRPGFNIQNYEAAKAREYWWFYSQGVVILRALGAACLGEHKETLAAIFAEEQVPIQDELTKLTAFLVRERYGETQAALERGVDLADSEFMDAQELKLIWKELRSQILAMEDAA